MSFDDEYRTTICPHETFAANDGANNFAHHPESHLAPADELQRWRGAVWKLTARLLESETYAASITTNRNYAFGRLNEIGRVLDPTIPSGVNLSPDAILRWAQEKMTALAAVLELIPECEIRFGDQTCLTNHRGEPEVRSDAKPCRSCRMRQLLTPAALPPVGTTKPAFFAVDLGTEKPRTVLVAPPIRNVGSKAVEPVAAPGLTEEQQRIVDAWREMAVRHAAAPCSGNEVCDTKRTAVDIIDTLERQK